MAAEPRVEELLASIRKAIDHDISELDRRGSRVPKLDVSARPAIPQPTPPAQLYAGEANVEIAKLRERVNKHRLEAAPPLGDVPMAPRVFAPKLPQPQKSTFGNILNGPIPSLRGTLEDEPRGDFAPRWDEPQYEADQQVVGPEYIPEAEPYVEPVYDEPPQAYAQQGALMSPHQASAAQSSFEALAQAMVMNVGGHDQIQDMTLQMLRPMLQQWLDDNLPSLVERLVREEIERVARRER